MQRSESPMPHVKPSTEIEIGDYVAGANVLTRNHTHAPQEIAVLFCRRNGPKQSISQILVQENVKLITWWELASLAARK